MRVPLIELLEKLAVDREMYPYETQPWLFYEDDEDITCSAEVRMGPGGKDVEAEIQLLYGEDAEVPELYVEEDEDEAQKESARGQEKPPVPLIINNRMQVLIMRAEPISQDQWGPILLKIKGIDYTNSIHDWEGKGCNVFVQSVQAMNMGEMPDFDAIIEKEMKDAYRGGGRRGRIGRKGIKMAQANPNQGMKKGM